MAASRSFSSRRTLPSFMGHQPLLVLYSRSQGFLLHGKSSLSSDWVVRDKKDKIDKIRWNIKSVPLSIRGMEKQLSMAATTRGYGGVHAWGIGQAVGWCVCAPSLRTVDAFPVVTSLPPKNFGGREATTGNASAVRRLVCPLLFVCVAGMDYFRVTLPKPLFQSEATWEAIK